MPAKVNLSKMSLDQLKALKKDVEKEIADFEVKKRAEALKEIQEVAKKHGVSVDELLGKKSKRGKSKILPKYRNPDDESQTWSGRGRQPDWYKAAISSGKKPADLEI